MARRRPDEDDARYQEDLEEIEREYEERVEASRRRASARGYSAPPKRDKKKPKAPLLLRFLAWCGVILFCFVVGYVGTGYMVEKLGLNKPWTKLNSNINDAGSVAEAELLESSAAKLDMQKAALSVFYTKDGELRSENVDVIARTLEDNIQEAVHRILKLSGMTEAVSVLHVFKDVDTVYLNFSASFLDALNEVGEKAGSLLITAVTRTMKDNFSLTKVRFLVDSKVVSSGAPVDLASVWQSQM